jgi:H+/Na+-translocating ferredoxin:NAD+ oxidoreductase subunit B
VRNNSSQIATLAERIDALLPQTQCTRCGYPACKPYADAIARGEAEFNQCPPGGKAGIESLAVLLGREPKPLNPLNGVEKPREIALIDEETCIGCTKCIQACPVDAIVGGSKMMHTILVDECTGCELCIPPCPVDCIAMIPAVIPADPVQYRERYYSRVNRLAREDAEHAAELSARKTAVAASVGRSAVLEAIARAKAKKTSSGKTS